MNKKQEFVAELFQNDLPDDIEIKGSVAVDTETMGLKIKRDRLCLVQMATSDNKVYLVQFQNKYKAPNLVKILNDPTITKIYHYARFDVAAITHYLKCSPKNNFCTKIASFLARTYTDRHGLKNVVKELLNVELDKTEQSSYWGTDTLTKKQMDYATQDVIHLHQLWEIFKERLARENRLKLAQKCFDFIPTRVELDLAFGEELDIFHHRLTK